MYKSNQRQPLWKAGYLGNRENQSLTCAHVRCGGGDSGGSVGGDGGVLGYHGRRTGVEEGLGCGGGLGCLGVTRLRRRVEGTLGGSQHPDTLENNISIWFLVSFGF